MEQNPRLELELEQSLTRTYAKAAKLRPANTVKAYSAKQREFMAWCDKREFPPPTQHTVTPAKLHLFLDEEVIGRKRKRTSKNGPSPTIGEATVLAYTAAVVDLWSQQKRLGVNNYENPRGDGVKQLLKNVAREADYTRKKNYDGRGVGTLLDGYTTVDQMVRIGEHFWNARADHGVHLRNWLAFLLSHFALLRGESARALELPDLHTVKLEGEGFSECKALILIMRQGKTNHVGRLEVGACLRNKDVRVCPIGALGFCLFWRWHAMGETPPDFSASCRWYDTKLLRAGPDVKCEMSYRVHHAAITAALRAAGLHTKAKTHVGRGSGAKMAELSGASEAQIRRLGRWNNQAMELCYLSALPREVMRTMAGFGKDQGLFFLKRAYLDPPQELQRMIFPWVETWEDKLQSGQCEENIAAGGFLCLLKYLRLVILQDTVCLRSTWRHPLWDATVFCSAEFQSYAARLDAHIRTADDPTELMLQRAMPLLSAKVDTVYNQLSSAITDVQHNVSTLRDAVVAPLVELQHALKSVRVNISFGDQTMGSAHSPEDSVRVVPASTPTMDSSPPIYTLSRGICTVRDLWREWHEGLGGKPSILSLEERWGAKWCEGNERRFFNRRQQIIKAVMRRALSSTPSKDDPGFRSSVDAAIQFFDTSLVERRKSLDWLSKNLTVLSG